MKKNKALKCIAEMVFVVLIMSSCDITKTEVTANTLSGIWQGQLISSYEITNNPKSDSLKDMLSVKTTISEVDIELLEFNFFLDSLHINLGEERYQYSVSIDAIDESTISLNQKGEISFMTIEKLSSDSLILNPKYLFMKKGVDKRFLKSQYVLVKR